MLKLHQIIELFIPITILAGSVSLLLCLPLETPLDQLFQIQSVPLRNPEASQFFDYEEVVQRRLSAKFRSFRDFITCSEISHFDRCFAKFQKELKREITQRYKDEVYQNTDSIIR